MFAIRARRKTVTEKDFLDAVQKVRRSRRAAVIDEGSRLQGALSLS